MRQDSPIAIGNFFISEACVAEVAVCQVLRLNDRFGPGADDRQLLLPGNEAASPKKSPAPFFIKIYRIGTVPCV